MTFFKKICLANLTAIIAACFFMAGCSPNYLYSTIDVTAFATQNTLSAPTAPEQTLNSETLFTTNYVEVLDRTITLSAPTLTNYVIDNLHDYIFIVNTDAVLTFNNVLHTRFAWLIVCPNSTLYLNINTNIFCGQDFYDLELSTDCSIFANNLFIFGNGSLNSSLACIKSTYLTTNCTGLSLYSNSAAVVCSATEIYGNLNFYSQTGLQCNNITIDAEQLNFDCEGLAIECDNLIVENGNININAQEGIVCKQFVKKHGYITLGCNIGITCQSIKILDGYLYGSCKSSCIKSSHEFVHSGGTTLLVSQQENFSAIDAETADFMVLGGCLVTNSTYACAPEQNALFFAVNKNDLFTCKSSTAQLTYIVQVSGSLMVASTAQYNYYSTHGKLVDFKNNFYGLLINATVNTYSSKSINSSQPNNGAIIYNDKNSSGGQLF